MTRTPLFPIPFRRLPALCCLFLLPFCLLPSCITEDVPADTRRGNFEAMWRTFDQHYCFFDLKRDECGLDWNEVYGRYAQAVSENMTERQLFDLLADMSFELRDGHVNVYAPHDVARYGAWYDDWPMNFSDSLERAYLGRAEDYMVASGLKYRILDDNIGYVRCASFEAGFGDGNLHELIRGLSMCDAMIVDVRSNGGGMITAAQKLASLFVNTPTVGGYMCHKTGPGHSDFSEPKPVVIEPFKGLRWQKPVAVLTNRRSYSATNCFVMYMKGLPDVTIVGDMTGGGAGMPFTSELPNGWKVRFSACPIYDRDMRLTEAGIAPDVKVDITSDDYRRDIDTIIETARRIILSADN